MDSLLVFVGQWERETVKMSYQVEDSPLTHKSNSLMTFFAVKAHTVFSLNLGQVSEPGQLHN